MLFFGVETLHRRRRVVCMLAGCRILHGFVAVHLSRRFPVQGHAVETKQNKKPTEKPRERSKRVGIEYGCMTWTKAYGIRLVVGRENAIETPCIRFDKKLRDTAVLKRFLI